MRIGVDIDGVLADVISKILEWHNRVYGTNYRKEQIVNFQFERLWGGTHEQAKKKIFEEFYHSEEFDDTKPLDGAVDVLKKLSKKHKLVAVTARPAEIKAKTKDWLDEYFPEIFSEVFYNDDWENVGVYGSKVEICQKNHIALIIEDSVENAQAFAEEGIPALLLDYPWNQSDALPENVTRVKNWDEIVKLINSNSL